MKRSLGNFVLVLALTPCFTHAQAVNLDSLLRVWSDDTWPDTSRAKALGVISSKGFLYTHPDSALKYARLLFDFATVKRLDKYQADALNTQGVVMSMRSNMNEALAFFDRSLKIRKAIGDSVGIASSLNNMGIAYSDLGQYYNAIDYYSQGYEVRRSIGDKAGVAASLSNLGEVYSHQGNHLKAIEYATRSLRISEEIGDKRIAAAALGNIGNIYYAQADYAMAIYYNQLSLQIRKEMGERRGIATCLANLGVFYGKQNDLSRAIDHFEQSMRIRDDLRDKGGVAACLVNIGNYYSRQGETSKGFRYLTRSLKLWEEVGDRVGMASTLNNLGIWYKDTGRYAKALKCSHKAMNIAQEVGDLPVARDAARSLYETYKLIGEHSRALEMFKIYMANEDSLLSRENASAIVKQRLRYEFARMVARDSIAQTSEVERMESERTIARLANIEQRRITRAVMSLGVLVLVVGCTAIAINHRRNSHRHARKAAHLQTQVWRSQVNPQFIHTALLNINEYVQANERDLASSFLTRFARLMRAVLENARKDEVPLAADLAVLQDYLELEKARTADGFKYSIEVEPGIDAEEVMVPPMLFQPYAEQAIWSRLAKKSGIGHLVVSVRRRNGRLVLSLEDDGEGQGEVRSGSESPLGSEGAGITEARLALLSKPGGEEASVTKTALPQGQCVELILPLSLVA